MRCSAVLRAVGAALVWLSVISPPLSCPGRGAAFFMPLRRAGIHVSDARPGGSRLCGAAPRGAAPRPGHENSPPPGRDLVERYVLVDADIAGQAEHALGD